MSFKDYIQNQIQKDTVLGWLILYTLVTITLLLFVAIFISMFTWPFSVLVYIGTLFGYTYFKYKKDTE